MKRKIMAIATLLMCVAAFFSFVGCAKKQPDETLLTQTDAATFFDEKVLPYILQYGTVAVGVLSVVVPLLGKINKSRKTFDAASAAIEAVKDVSEQTDKRVKAKDKEIAALKGEIAVLRQESAAIKKMCEIAFCNNKELVTNGHAKEIMRLAEVGKGAENEN